MVVRIDLEKGSRIDFRRLGVEQIKFVGSGLKGKLESIGVNHISFKLPDDTEVARLNPDSSSFELIKPKLQGDLNANGYRVTNVGNVLPNSDNTYSLGSESVRWKEVNSVSVVSNHVKAKWQDIETIYVSPDGGGDGSSPDKPTTLDDALTRSRARRVVIVLADGEYHIRKNYELFGDYIEIKSQSGDASKVKIVFDTYVSGGVNLSYGLHLLNTILVLRGVTLENAPKADDSLGWGVSGQMGTPIVVGGSTPCKWGTVFIHGCVVSQTRDYFILSKHTCGVVSIRDSTINMSGDAIALIINSFGGVCIGWYNSSITSGYKLTTGLQGRDVLFSGNINSVSASKTWFSEVPESVLPKSDNAYDLGSESLRWANVYAVNIYAGDINLDNNWRITEYDENGKLMNGVRILNARGEEVLRITEDGVWFKGKKITGV